MCEQNVTVHYLLTWDRVNGRERRWEQATDNRSGEVTVKEVFLTDAEESETANGKRAL